MVHGRKDSTTWKDIGIIFAVSVVLAVVGVSYFGIGNLGKLNANPSGAQSIIENPHPDTGAASNNPCDGVTCPDKCTGSTRYYNGQCSNGQCQYNSLYCQNGCSGGLCNFPPPAIQQSYKFTTYENTEPYYSTYCDKIDPYDLSVREAAANAIRNDPGSYSMSQLFDIYDWVKQNIIYQSVPLQGVPYSPSETLITKSGDCKNQAVLIASMIGAIGGTAKVVADPICEHSYAIVYFGSPTSDINAFSQAVTSHYGQNTQINYITNNDGIWVYFDPAGGNYPGNLLHECSGERSVYSVTSCLDCSEQYSNMPYTFGDKCYSQCPMGTGASNSHACYVCPQGSYGLNNKCLTCQSGYVLHTDGRCYPG